MNATTERSAELSEQDINEAIAYWLSNSADIEHSYDAEGVTVYPILHKDGGQTVMARAVTTAPEKGA